MKCSIREPPGPGTVVGARSEVTRTPALLECISQLCAADGAGNGLPLCQLVGVPFGPTVSKLGLLARLRLFTKLLGGQTVAAASAALPICGAELSERETLVALPSPTCPD